MNTLKRIKFPVLVSFCFMVSLLYSQNEKTINKTFDSVESIHLELVLGNCKISKSPDAKTHLQLTYTFDEDQFDADFQQIGNRLNLEEYIEGKGGDGSSNWNLRVPDKIEIDLETATGEIEVDGLKLDLEANSATGKISIRRVQGELELNSGTGNIELLESEGEMDINSGTGNIQATGCKGDIELNSGTGKVSVNKCQGEYDVNSGTGGVMATDIVLTGDGEFNSGTGSVEIKAPSGDNFTLEINSGTSDAVLDMAGLKLEGYFEFRANARKGKIVSPEKFDKEEESGRNGEVTLIKSFTRNGNMPRYIISTGTGEAVLKK